MPQKPLFGSRRSPNNKQGGGAVASGEVPSQTSQSFLRGAFVLFGHGAIGKDGLIGDGSRAEVGEKIGAPDTNERTTNGLGTRTY